MTTFTIHARREADQVETTFTYDNQTSALLHADGTPVIPSRPLQFGDAEVVSVDQPGRKGNIKTLKISLGLSCNYECGKMLESRAMEPKKFDIDGLITKELGVPVSNAKINVKLRVCGALAAYLQEAPMDRAQKVIQTGGGWLEIEAKVEDTAVFRNWLMSLGANAVVMAPKSLSRALFNEAKAMCDLYLEKSSAVRN